MPEAIALALLAMEKRLTRMETRLEAVCTHLNLTTETETS